MSIGPGWIGSEEQLLNALRVAGSDKDEEGKFLIWGERPFKGLDGDIVVGNGMFCRINNKMISVAGILRGTGNGTNIQVISYDDPSDELLRSITKDMSDKDFVFLVLRQNGKLEKIPKKSLSLQELQELVGGYIERVRFTTRPQIYLIVNKEGLLKDLPPNAFFPQLVGDIIVAGIEEVFVPDEDNEVQEAEETFRGLTIYEVEQFIHTLHLQMHHDALRDSTDRTT